MEKFDKSPYTPPEILMGKNHSYACDVWSLGMLLYELLFGSLNEVKVDAKGVEMEIASRNSIMAERFPEQDAGTKPRRSAYDGRH